MNQHIKDICKIGQGVSCCRYLVAGPKGLECAKVTDHKQVLDFRAATGTMTARSDNCGGYPMETSLIILNEKSEL